MSEDLRLEVFADKLGFPEGPVAMSDGSILYVDIEKQTLSKVWQGRKPEVVVELPGGPNGVAIGPDGAAYVCNNGGVYTFRPVGPGGVTVPTPERPNYDGGCIQRVDLETKEVTPLFTEYEGRKLLAPDDIVFDEAGGFWFTETGIQEPDVTRNGGLYYVKPDMKTLIKAATIPMPNGVGLRPDGKVVYVSDTVFGRLWALSIESEGKLKKEEMPGKPGDVVQTLPKFQWLDSLKVEENGNICVGTIFNGGITVFTPEGETEHYPVPDMFTTNLCFGGNDMRDVWITASSTGKIYKGRWPRPGLKLAFNA